MKKTIIILGGYGVFGSRVADMLSDNKVFDIVVAGRSANKAIEFCRNRNCCPLTLDTSSKTFVQDINSANPFAVIDATGPFQNFREDPYKVACAAIACGAHYLDLSDDAFFTKEISELNDQAIAAGVCVLSGVSSVPALTSAVVESLKEGLTDIHLIESTILPGNKAPRGLSVVKAIVGQAGKPMKIWRGGKFVNELGWSDRKRTDLDGGNAHRIYNRWASFIGAPDLILFPEHFKARSVLFRAGLDLKLMHGGLEILSWLVRLKIVKSLTLSAPVLKWMADRFESFGSDLGGMQVRVAGLDGNGKTEERRWTLVVGDGKGPNVPALPARIICQKLLAGDIHPGARPCISEFSLQEAEKAIALLPAKTSQKTTTPQLVFERALGRDYALLPPPIADLHRVIDVRRWAGRGKITRGNSVLANIAAWLAGFPQASDDITVEVEMRRSEKGEVWTRTFGDRRFKSYICLDPGNFPGRIWEQFGLMRFRIDLKVSNGKLIYPVTAGRLLGVPMPKFILPQSSTSESVDEAGRACFDVNIAMPIGGHVASYKGWLESTE
ncbi:DUF4166 domain-containing protein [Hyphococcus flavus]|uniref:DUF4166 domain-containing protein n=1 Tax=Hyphococcus flavus TaxID=1866326 RepID=A0AAF0CFX4_9PROT|nr:SDR family oxidoreductase [Hyphococcus flavus]WDI30057.1 DUF4166 domain-containing protein [Hyphococcus flavus]